MEALNIYTDNWEYFQFHNLFYGQGGMSLNYFIPPNKISNIY